MASITMFHRISQYCDGACLFLWLATSSGMVKIPANKYYHNTCLFLRPKARRGTDRTVPIIYAGKQYHDIISILFLFHWRCEGVLFYSTAFHAPLEPPVGFFLGGKSATCDEHNNNNSSASSHVTPAHKKHNEIVSSKVFAGNK